MLHAIEQAEAEIYVGAPDEPAPELGRVVVWRLNVVAGQRASLETDGHLAAEDLADHRHHVTAGHAFAAGQMDELIGKFWAEDVDAHGGGVEDVNIFTDLLAGAVVVDPPLVQRLREQPVDRVAAIGTRSVEGPETQHREIETVAFAIILDE